MIPYNYDPKNPYSPTPYVTNIEQKSMQNANFRTAIWTGNHVQMTLMCIPVCSDIGLEIHPDTDQLIRIEQGMALVKMAQYNKYWKNTTKSFFCLCTAPPPIGDGSAHKGRSTGGLLKRR